jgi:hypothetical protein
MGAPVGMWQARHPRAAAGLIGAGLYVVVGWLLLSHVLAGGIRPIDQSADEAPPAVTCICAQAAPRIDRGATELTLLIISGVDGSTSHCFVPAHLVSNDAIVAASADLVGISRALDCT